MDRAEIDENGKGLLFYGTSLVKDCIKINGQKDVFLLRTTVKLERKEQVSPLPGQFYLIRSKKSEVQYDRPISVYSCKESICPECGKKTLSLEFMILEKGKGTMELCNLREGDEVELIGPLGKGWNKPENINTQKAEICIVGGGIGVAPVANLASSLPSASYDFYASFKSGSYGLENINARNLYITTDDGSVGIHGMLPAALSREAVIKAGYKVIYACGPSPMLSYVKSLAEELGIQCWLSMEHRMLCGLGVCLGCTIETTQGILRVCKDGPVFDSKIIKFAPSSPRRKPLAAEDDVDISFDFKGIHFDNPVIAASGTFAFGENYRGVTDVKAWGGISAKGCTLEPRQGNGGERSIEVPSGNINSVGLQNPGIPVFCREILPDMMKLGPVIIANLAGSDIDSYVKGAELLDKTDVPAIELNISCPNVKSGGQAWGLNPDSAFECVSAVRKATKKPLIVKLSPNAPDYRAVAMAVVKAGADALSLINTIQAVAIDIEKAKPFFNNVRAGLCGPAVKPVALRIVYDVVEEMNKLPAEQRIPVIGLGGISTWQDAVEFIMAGASAIQIGAAKFRNPDVAIEVVEGLKKFMKSHGYKSIKDMCGLAQVK